MKTTIRRYSRSALSVLLTLCMLFSCISVGVIATDAAQVDSDSAGATYYIHHATSRDGIKTASGHVIDSGYTTNVAAGEFNVSVNTSSTANQSNLISSVSLPSGVYDNGSQEFDQWHYYRLWFGSAMNNVRFTYSSGTLTVSAESNYLLMSADGGTTWTNLGQVTLSNNKASMTINSSDKSMTSGVNYRFVMSKSDSDATQDAFAGNSIGVNGDSGLTNVGYETFDTDKHAARIQLANNDDTNITIAIDASAKSYKFSTDKLYSVTVNAGEHGSVTAGGTTVSANTGQTVSKIGSKGVTLKANPATDYAFYRWVVTGAASVGDANSANTVLKATANGGTVTAQYKKNYGSRTIYFDATGVDWATGDVYAYAEYTDPVAGLVKPLGDAPGTKMTKGANNVYSVGVDWATTTLTFRTADGSHTMATTHDGLTVGADTVPQKGGADAGTNRYFGATEKWGEVVVSGNQKTYDLGDSIKTDYKDSLYTGISATMFDYYTDSEINASGGPVENWYTAINAASDGWTNGISNRQPTKKLNQALSVYAQKNNINYPMYFGAFNESGYKDPGYYHSSTTYNGQKINDSNSIGDSNNALPGLAGGDINSGTIVHAGSNVPMAMFDKEWLTRRTSTTPQSTVVTVKGTSAYDWADASAKMYVVFRDHWTANDNAHEYWGELTSQGDYTYTFDTSVVPTSCLGKKAYFLRLNSNTTGIITGDCTGGTPKANWDIADSKKWARFDVDSFPSNPGAGYYQLKDWNSATWTPNDYDYTGPLAQIFDGKFPVRKKTKDKIDYYTFNSSVENYDNKNHVDTVYFSNKYNDGTRKLEYTNVDTECVDSKYGGGPGFFPFDQRNNNGIGQFAKDYAFGMRLDIQFTLGKDGKIKSTLDNKWHDQKFEFTGDDDLWVYGDNNLVLDLGGDHKTASGEINFAGGTNTASVSYSSGIDSTLATPAYSVTVDNQDTTFVHTMTIFYMERGHHESNLKFGFSFTPLDSEYIADKVVKTDNVNSALLSDVQADIANETFTFNHKTSDTVNGSYTSTNSTQKEYAHVLANGTKENPAPKTNNAGQFTLKNKERADFVGQFTKGNYFEVTETTSGAYAYDVSSVVTDTETGANIPVTNNRFLFLTTLNDPGPFDKTIIKQVFTNQLKTHNFTVTKDIVGDYDKTKAFTVEVKVKLPGHNDFAVYQLPYKRDGVAGSSLPANGRVTIHQDEVLTFEGIPENSVIQVKETVIGDTFNYRYTKTEVVNGVDMTGIDNGIQFKVGQYGDPEVTVTNSKIIYRKLTVTKTVENAAQSDTTQFKYHVQVKNASGNFVSFDTDDTAGRTITNGGNQEVGNIEMGTVVKVYEDAPTGLYSFKDITVAGATATVDKTNRAATFTVGYDDITVNLFNRKTPKYTLTVEKAVTGDEESVAADKEFEIKVEVNPDNSDEDGWIPLADAAYISSLTSGTVNRDGTLSNQGMTTVRKGEKLTFTEAVIENYYIRITEVGTLPDDCRFDKIESTKSSDNSVIFVTTNNITNGGYFKMTEASDVVITNYMAHRYNFAITKNTDINNTTDSFKIKVYTKADDTASTSWVQYTETLDSNRSAGATRAANKSVATDNDHYGEYDIIKNETVTVKGLLENTLVKVVETDCMPAKYTLQGITPKSGTSFVTAGDSTSGVKMTKAGLGVDITNNVQKTSVQIVKNVTSGSGTGFPLTVKITNEVTGDTTTTYSNNSGVTIKNGTEASLTIDSGDAHKITISDVPVGASVEVAEEDISARADYSFASITATDVTGLDTDNQKVSFKTLNKVAKVTVGNALNSYDVTIEKVIQDKDGNTITTDTDTEFPLTINVGGTETSEKIKCGTNIVKQNVPYGTTVTVSEPANTMPRGFFLKSITGNGTVTVNGHTTITVTNKMHPTYDVKVIKKAETDAGAGMPAADQTFKVTITPPANVTLTYALYDKDGNKKTGTGASGTFSAATEFTLKNDEYVLVGGLLQGEKITVKETDDGAPNYAFDKFKVGNTESTSASYEYTVTNGDVAAQTIEVHNKIGTIDCEITFVFPSRTYVTGDNAGEPRYGSDLKYKVTKNGVLKTAAVDGAFFKKDFLQSITPHEKNFLQMMEWGYDKVAYTNNGGKYTATVTATNGDITTKKVTFVFPYASKEYEVKSEDGTATLGYVFGPVDPDNPSGSPESQFKTVGYQANPVVPKEVTYTNADGTTGTKTKYVGTFAAQTFNGQDFLYWSIRAQNRNAAKNAQTNEYPYEEVARCYESIFNYTIFDDYMVVPVYGTASEDQGKEKDTYTYINFLEYSRNHWNNGERGTNPGYPNYENGDIVWTDFDVAFEDGAKLLSSDKNAEIGIMVERVSTSLEDGHALNPGASDYASHYAYYADKYANRTTDEIVTRIKSGANKNTWSGDYNLRVIDKSILTNKNRCEYGFGIFVHTDQEQTEYKNALYRAYSYIKVGTGNDARVILSQTPVYFSVQNEAGK